MENHKQEEVKAFARMYARKLYCSKEIDDLIACMEPETLGIGAGGRQFFGGNGECITFLQELKGKIPTCRIWDEEYIVVPLADRLYLVHGWYYVETDKGQDLFIKVRQRVSMVIREKSTGYCYLSIHMSNPYEELFDDEFFPIKMAKQTYAYMEEELSKLRKSLKQKERQMEVVLKSVNGGLKCSYDDEVYSYAFISDELPKMFGYTKEEFLAVSKGSATGACYPPDLKKALETCEECFKNNNPTYSTKYRIRCKDGSLKWVMDSGRKVMDKAGNCLIYSIYLDVTKDEEIREKIWMQKQLLDSIYEFMMCGVFRYSVWRHRELRSVHMNPMALKMLGYHDEADCLQQGLKALKQRVFPQDDRRMRDVFKKLLEEGTSRTEEFRIQKVDGKVIWVCCQITVVERQEELLTYQSVLMDITEQKALQKQVENVRQRELEHERAQKQDYYNVISGMSKRYYAIHLVNLDEGSYFTLRAPEDMEWALNVGTCYDADLRRVTELYFHPEERDKIFRYFNLAALHKQNQRRDMEVSVDCRRLVSGQYRWSSFIATLMLQNRGEQQVIVALRDIHGEKMKELAEQQAVKEAFQAARMANITKNEFLSRMSHDIRTPLNAIIGMTTIMSAHLNDQERLRNCLGKINVSSKHLLSLINEVLDMGKIESGKMHLDEGPFSIADMVQDLMDILRPQMDEKKHQCSVAVEQSLREDVIGDRFRIRQVLLNILGNAVKYTPEQGRISLRIREKNFKYPSMGWYEFIVEDSGIGMKQDFISKIFEPFTRAEDSRISEVEGTGLGMAIALNIVRMMNGTIDVTSELGKGSRFTVTLCLQLQRENKKLEENLFYGLPVLVIADEKNVYENTCLLLEQIGLRLTKVFSVGSIKKQIKRAAQEQTPYFAVVLAKDLLREDRIQLIKEIRSLLGTGSPTRILSCQDDLKTGSKEVEPGVDAVLSGPLFLSTLLRIFHGLAQEQAGKDKPEEVVQTLEGMRMEKYAGKRILLVEDNELNMEIAYEILKCTNVRIDTAVNGKEALEIFQSCPENAFDLIFMDIQMPVMNGLEATQAIRALNRKDSVKIPIIAMTANAFVEDIKTAKQAGMNEHMSKPIDLGELQKVLRKWLL